MKIIFAGTPEFAAQALAAIHAAGHEVCLVLTQPDRPAGRGMKLQASAVAKYAESHGLNIAKPVTLKTPDALELIANCRADVMVVAAYGLLLPQAILDLPRLGCINIHGSLLPRWRGAAPVQRAIEAGDTQTGIGIMQMEAGLDTGPVLLERVIAIEPTDTAASLFAKLTALGAECIVEALKNLETLTPRPQADVGITYAKKIEKNEARMDWSESATVLERRVRAFDPFPGCETNLSGERLKVWQASVCGNAANTPAGVVADVQRDAFVVACGEHALRITSVQRAGGRRISTAELLQSFPLSTGQQCT
jgi:methionyl-tRNA formyltransferase